MAQTRYIHCKILPGLFKTELYVSVLGSSVYVDRSAVQILREPEGNQEGEGLILGYLIEEGTGDQALVELTGEAVVGGLRTWVPKTALAAA